MPIPVRERFVMNLDRVRGLIALHQNLTGPSPGRSSVPESDLLRAAVVLLHAALEDLLRTLASSRLPLAGRDILQRVPFPGGDGRKTTWTLGDLASFRGRTVEEMLGESIAAYLDRRSYNSADDVAGALTEMDLPVDLLRPYATRIQALMTRRHQIAHRLDIDESTGPGPHHVRSLGRTSVGKWLESARQFGLAVIARSETDSQL